MNRSRLLFSAALAALVCTACATPPSPQQVQDDMRHGLSAAAQRYDEQLYPEAYLLADAVGRVDPGYEGVAELLGKIQAQDAVYGPSWLGINRSIRTKSGGFGMALLFWLPNRALDLLDLVSFDLGLGLGVKADVHATRVAQLAATVGVRGGVGWHKQRSLGVQTASDAGVGAGPFGALGAAGMRAGTSGVRSGGGSVVALYGPTNEIYQTWDDYWAVGAAFMLPPFGPSVELDLHPIELIDFLGGLILLDLSRDDWGTTRNLKLDGTEKALIEALSRAERANVR